MKALIKVLTYICIAVFMVGFAYTHLTAEKDYVITERPFVEVVRSGDTVDDILGHYYNSDNEGVTFGEWKYNILHLPQNKHLLNEKGGLKYIYPGDKIHIVCKIRVAK